MMIASVLQAVREVAVRTDILWIAPAEDLDIEVIVGRRREIGELLIAIVPFSDHAEIESVQIPALGGFQIRGSHGDVVATHIGER